MADLFDLADADRSGFIDPMEFQQLYGNLTNKREPLGKINALMKHMGGQLHHLDMGDGIKTQEQVLILTKEIFIEAASSENLIQGIKRNDWMDWIVQHNAYSTYVSAAFQVMLICHAPISQRLFVYFDCNMFPGKARKFK